MSSKFRITNGKAHIAVMRGADDKPWWVACGICRPGYGLMFGGLTSGGGLLSQANVIAWAPTWGVAQTWALRHAADHEALRCPTCDHLPLEKVETPAMTAADRRPEREATAPRITEPTQEAS